MKLYAISDHHFGHENIIKYCHRPVQNATEDAERLVRIHNEVVDPQDYVMLVGDLSASKQGTEFLKRYIPQLHGHLILIRGNHDYQVDQFYLDLGIEAVHDVVQYKQFLFCHYPQLPGVCEFALKNKAILVCGHTHKPFPDYQDGIERINVGVDIVQGRPVLITDMSSSN